ncbi:MAG: hypothetical protein OSP8Acid_09960 [uncultured Acidilobus sp. OSP8]|nr:MAG: hypothetical protein OSP8Acid_09960 [uncultured Acidilobus sp. OSP8]
MATATSDLMSLLRASPSSRG